MNIEEKRVEFDNASCGSAGLETAFAVLNQIFDLETTITLLTKGRERYQLETTAIKEGETASLTLFEPKEEFIFNKNAMVSASKNSMFLEKPMKGRVFGIISNKQILI